MKRFLSLALLLSVSASYASEDVFGRPVRIDLVNRDASRIRHDLPSDEEGILELGKLLTSRNKKELDELFEDFSELQRLYQTYYGRSYFDGNTVSYVFHVHNKVAKRNIPEELELMKPFSELFGYIPGKNYNKQ